MDALTPPTTSDAPPERAASSKATDRLLLVAIGAVVLVVSFPRLRDWTVRSNEFDARATLALLASELFGASEVHAAQPSSLGERFLEHEELRHRLTDARVLADGERLAYHGYVFDLAQAESGPRILAWPRAGGASGVQVYALDLSGKLYEHNAPERFRAGARPFERADEWSVAAQDGH